MHGAWESRSSAGDNGIEILTQSTVTKCIPLSLLNQMGSTDQLDLQSLINGWHEGATLQAFTDEHRWLCLQLLRFLYHSPGWAVKQQHPHLIPQTLRIPLFTTADKLDVVWRVYQGCIQSTSWLSAHLRGTTLQFCTQQVSAGMHKCLTPQALNMSAQTCMSFS